MGSEVMHTEVAIPFERDRQLSQVTGSPEIWDIVVIGGGATGLGTALDAASRGYRTLLLEKHDFAKGTSSRSTKLAHGGVRYLRNGEVGLVFKALRERGLMVRNAPHLVRNLRFVIPCKSTWETLYYAAGLKLYDLLALGRGLSRSKIVRASTALAESPGLSPDHFHAGVTYYDAQFDDARFGVNLAQTAVREGATVLNYCEVTALLREEGRISGVKATDRESGRTHSIPARCVINATGVFADRIRHMDDGSLPPMVRASQGVHVVLDGSFLEGEQALMVPETDDGRVLFAIPWKGSLLIGTTDTSVDEISEEPVAMDQEIEYLLAHAGRYLARPPTRADVRSVFVGLRPLVSDDDADTKSISRDHTIRVSRNGLLTITGGKWTTYRLMAEEVVDEARKLAGLPRRASGTRSLRLQGWDEAPGSSALGVYGADRPSLEALLKITDRGRDLVHPDLPVVRGQVVWAVRREMARTVEDVLARRTRALLLDARASMEAAAEVAGIMAEELGRSSAWCRQQEEQFAEIAALHCLDTDEPVISGEAS